MATAQLLGRRFAWLMAGAAIALAVVLLVTALASVAATAAPVGVIVLVAIAVGGALGLVPGVRELEVTGARAMLGAEAELVAPARTRPAHRVQTVAWVLLHLVSGLLVAGCLFLVLPVAAAGLVASVTGRPSGLGLVTPSTTLGRVGWAFLAVLVAAVALLSWWLLGVLAARLVGRFLGPTTHDRLEVAIARADREADRNRIARELHDGIGHALTIIGVQAAAGRRIQQRDPDGTTAALATIESTARDALAELDGMLAVLREQARDTTAPPDVEQIVAANRRAGLDLSARIDLPEHLPELLRRNLNRIVTELLTNAHRHGAAGPVRLTLGSSDDTLTIEVTNPLGTEGTTRPGSGHGLTGLGERAALFGGTVEAGPVDDSWVARATLPLPRGGRA